MNHNYIILLLVLFNIVFFILGYILGKFYNTTNIIEKPNSFLKNNNVNDSRTKIVDIDEKKMVVPIKTQGLEKKYNTLGDISTTSDNISDSVNKLKNLKR